MNYKLYLVNPDHESFDFSDVGYEMVKECATQQYEAESIYNLFCQMVTAYNEGQLPTEHFMYVTDEANGIILAS